MPETLIERALRTATDTKAIEAGRGVVSRTGDVFARLFPGRTAIIVADDRVIAVARNERELLQDPTAHAEIIAIRQAARSLGTWRLTGCTLYVTIEPCPMCAGALVQARLTRLVYGAADPKAGAVDTLYRLLSDERLNHQVQVTAGVKAGACAAIMQDFFRRLRT
mgnify:CR=1 FL=1